MIYPIKAITKKNIKYIDQGIFSLSTLSLNLLAPIFFSSSKAAEILYYISYLLLFLAISSAVFVTQILSVDNINNGKVERIFNYFSLTFSLAFLITFIIGNIFSSIEIYFLYFSYILCSFDFFRKFFIRLKMDHLSLLLSIYFCLAIICSYTISSAMNYDFWKISFILTAPMSTLSFYLALKSISYSRIKVIDINYLKVFIKNGLFSLISFVLAWIATQGVFITLFDTVSNTVFVEQKVIFSSLGFVNIIMIVQENKYQPKYSQVLSSGTDKSMHLTRLDSLVNKESHIIAIICIAITLLLYLYGFEFYISFILLSLYRYFFGLSKSNVYYFRATNNYQFILLSSLISLLFLGTTHLIFKNYINNSLIVPIYFITYSLVFLLFSTFFKQRLINAKHRYI